MRLKHRSSSGPVRMTWHSPRSPRSPRSLRSLRSPRRAGASPRSAHAQEPRAQERSKQRGCAPLIPARGGGEEATPAGEAARAGRPRHARRVSCVGEEASERAPRVRKPCRAAPWRTADPLLGRAERSELAAAPRAGRAARAHSAAGRPRRPAALPAGPSCLMARRGAVEPWPGRAERAAQACQATSRPRVSSPACRIALARAGQHEDMSWQASRAREAGCSPRP